MFAFLRVLSNCVEYTVDENKGNGGKSALEGAILAITVFCYQVKTLHYVLFY